MKKKGKFFFISTPYSFDLDTKKHSLKKIVFGGGPRRTYDDFHLISNVNISVPTYLNNDKVDIGLGLTTTYLWDYFELDSALSYNLKNILSPIHSFYGGGVFGGKISDEIRLVGGFNCNISDKLTGNIRIVSRHIPSKKIYFEMIYDQGLDSFERRSIIILARTDL